MQVMIDSCIVLSSQALSRFLVHSSNALFNVRIHELENMAQKSCVLTGTILDCIEILLVVSGLLKDHYLMSSWDVSRCSRIVYFTFSTFTESSKIASYMEFQAYRN